MADVQIVQPLQNCKTKTSATLKIQTKAGFLLDLHAKKDLSEIAKLPPDKLFDISLLNAPEFTAIHDSTNIIEILR